MSAGVEEAPDQRGASRFGRAFLLGTIVVELIGLTVCFDASHISQNGRWFWPWLTHTNQFACWVSAAAVATALFGDTSGWGQHLRPGKVLGFRHHRWVFFLAHAMGFLAFAAITAVLLGGDPNSLVRVRGASISGAAPVVASFWFVAWAGAGLAALLLWCAAMLPPRSWFPWAKAQRGALLAGIVVGSLAWVAAQLTVRMWSSLSLETFATVSRLLSHAGVDVVCIPEQFIIGSRRFLVSISPQCSGYEGVGLVGVFAGAVLWRSRKELQFPGAFSLLPIATVVIWLVNCVRIAALILLGINCSPAVAVAGFHSLAAWLVWNVVTVGLVIGARRFRFFERVED